ncbi:MAG: SLBB domain-containing protein [Firmicutes bacterium]|nr:SLBB domain-containing protein [Bacillota bacterium]
MRPKVEFGFCSGMSLSFVHEGVRSENNPLDAVDPRIEKIKNAGVVGAGGAGFSFPCEVSEQGGILIGNGAECEPLLSVDKETMTLFAPEVVKGMKIVIELSGAKKGFIGVKKKNYKAVEALEKAAAGAGNIEVSLLENVYPAGDEQALVYDILGRTVPEGGIPLHVGVIVNNVGTLVNISRALEGTPVTHRMLTVAGDVREPATLNLPIGTSFREAIMLAGGSNSRNFKILVGGPMMGCVESDLDKPVLKTTSGIVILDVDHPFMARKSQSVSARIRIGKSACDQCMYCTDLCPRYLLGHYCYPHLIMRAVPYGLSYTNIVTTAFMCCECGLCTYFSCPLRLSPGELMAQVKREMIRKGVKNPHARTDVKPPEFRAGRLIPVERLMERLELAPYYTDAPFRENGYKPQKVTIPLKQHLGAPSIPVVKAGDKVKAGQLIGEIPEGKLGARIHASVSGFVREAGDSVVIEAG